MGEGELKTALPPCGPSHPQLDTEQEPTCTSPGIEPNTMLKLIEVAHRREKVIRNHLCTEAAKQHAPGGSGPSCTWSTCTWAQKSLCLSHAARWIYSDCGNLSERTISHLTGARYAVHCAGRVHYTLYTSEMSLYSYLAPEGSQSLVSFAFATLLRMYLQIFSISLTLCPSCDKRACRTF